MNQKNMTLLAIAALVVAWAFDLLFWGTEPGISIAVFVAILLAAILVLAWLERVKVSPWSLILIGLILVFTTLTVMRQEPFTLFISFGILVVLLAGLMLTLSGGQWARFGLADWLVGFFRLSGSAAAGGIEVFSARGEASAEAAAEGSDVVTRRSTWVKIRPVLVGLVLALPVLFVLAVLLSSADPIFARLMDDLLEIENLPEYFGRAVYILMIAYALLGIFLFALTKSQEIKLIGVEQPLVKAFLGWVEAGTVLTLVNVLFMVFVGVQVRYFFGGETNINLEGFTYAEYARRGFSELVLVAALSLMLFLALSAITRRSTPVQRRVFSGLGVVLVALVGVMLVSAFQRLLLYEGAYGFTRLRAYTHVFLIWLGILLLVTVLLDVANRLRGFALALLVVTVGFGLSLGLLNVDGYIVEQNIQRARQGYELDTNHLASLSVDAVPAMADAFRAGGLGSDQVGLARALMCKKRQIEIEQPSDWRSYRPGIARAQRILTDLQPDLTALGSDVTRSPCPYMGD
jgi:hypothetical protein